MLKWDGTHLGQFHESIILAKTKTKHGRYWKIKIPLTDKPEPREVEVYCLAKIVKNFFPAIIDEIKPIFGLPKMGTHTLRIEGFLYLIIRIPTIRGIIIEDHCLNELTINPTTNMLFCRQVQEILCFRDLLALSSTYESSIHVRYMEPNHPFPISFVENNMNFTENKRPVLSKRMIKRWFGDTPINIVLLRLMRIGKDDLRRFPEILAKYRKDIEEAINRVNKDSIWCSNFILNRLSNRLLPLLE